MPGIGEGAFPWNGLCAPYTKRGHHSPRGGLGESGVAVWPHLFPKHTWLGATDPIPQTKKLRLRKLKQSAQVQSQVLWLHSTCVSPAPCWPLGYGTGTGKNKLEGMWRGVVGTRFGTVMAILKEQLSAPETDLFLTLNQERLGLQREMTAER